MTPPGPGLREPTPAGPIGWVLALAAAATVGYLFRGLVVPLLAAAILAYFLNPLVATLQARGVRRSVAVAGLFVGIGLLLLLVGSLVVPRFRAEGLALVANLPTFAAQIEGTVGRALQELIGTYPATRRLIPAELQAPGWLERLVEERTGHASDLVGHAGLIVFVLVLVPPFTFFLLRDAGRLIGFLMDRLHPVHVETTVAVWCEIDRIIGRYIRGLALDGIVVGIVAGLGLLAIGVPYPLLLGAFTAVVNPIPYLGTVLSVVVASLVALGAGQGLGTVTWILVLYAVVRLLDDAVIAFVTIGRSVHLHPMLIIASIIAGEESFGLLGMVVAVPLVTVIKETARLLLEHRRALARAGAPSGPASRPAAAHYVC